MNDYIRIYLLFCGIDIPKVRILYCFQNTPRKKRQKKEG